MSAYTGFPERPGQVTAIGVLTLVSAIFNILLAIGWTIGAIATLVGIICVPITILPAILGIFEIIYAAQLLSNPPRPLKPSQAIAILEIVCIVIGNPVALVSGILALVFYNDLTVKNYFAQINSFQVI